MSRLLATLDAPPSGRARPIWFDAAAYGQAKLLGGGPLPWPSPAELTAFYGKTQAMFGSDAILIEIADVFAQRAASDQALRVSMAARSRPGYALRTLLGDEQARATAAEAVRALAATSGAVPLVLAAPAPGRWLVSAAELAGLDPGPPNAGQAETAAMYCADFLRTFAGTGVDGLLLEEGLGAADGLVHAEAYRPVLNLADHYVWPVLIQTDAAAAWPYGPVSGVALWLGRAGPGQPSGRWGLVAGSGFWEGTEPPAEADLVFAAVPAQADPEAVMKRVRTLA